METSKQAENKAQAVAAGRRKWSLEERDAIVRASLKAGTTVSSVAQLYGVNPSQIYDWRKQARQEAQQKKPAALVPVLCLLLVPDRGRLPFSNLVIRVSSLRALPSGEPLSDFARRDACHSGCEDRGKNYRPTGTQ